MTQESIRFTLKSIQLKFDELAHSNGMTDFSGENQMVYLAMMGYGFDDNEKNIKVCSSRQ